FSAQRGLQTEYGEESRCRGNRGNTLRLSLAGELNIAMKECREPRKSAAAIAEIAEIPLIHGKLGKIRASEEEADETVRLRIRQRSDQDAIDDAEDSTVGSNGEGQGEHNHGREAGVASHSAQSITQVAEQVFDVVGAAHIAAFLLNDSHP